MDDLQSRHRKEQRDLVAKITQKKKQASKKTRKGVNDECDQLERELKERHAREVAELDGSAEAGDVTSEVPEAATDADSVAAPQSDLENQVKGLTLDAKSNQDGLNAQEGSQAQPQKRNRAKERLAKRAAEHEAIRAEAAEEAANMPDQKEVERKRMMEEFKRRGLQERIIRADGHCLYSAVADQLAAQELGLDPKISPNAPSDSSTNGETPAYKKVRHAAAAYIEKHPDDFISFLEEPLPDYLHKIRDTGEWGGQLELHALAKTYGVDFNIIQGNGQVVRIESSTSGDDEPKDLWLAYYRHGFGLGEHYNSLRKTP